MVCAGELRRPAGDPLRLRDISHVAGIRHRSGGTSLPPGGGWLGEAEAKALIAAAGVEVPEGRVVADVDDCIAAATELGWPVALKLTSPSLQHKSDAGAIELGIGDVRSLIVAARRLLDLPAALDAELLIERMAAPGLELIVAARSDAVVPALVIGLGGIWTEIVSDVAVVPLPATPERIERGLLSLRGAALLTGGRGGEPVDVGAVAGAAARVGELLLEEEPRADRAQPADRGAGGLRRGRRAGEAGLG